MVSVNTIILATEENRGCQCYHTYDLESLGTQGGLKARDGRLEFLNADHEWIRIIGVLWNPQGLGPMQNEASLLDMIMLSGVPCVNPAITMKLHSSRIASHTAMKKAGLPVIDAEWLIGQLALNYFYEPPYPSVIKVGDWHGGMGKMRIKNKGDYIDASDMACVTEDCIGFEPLLDYQNDIRCLLVGDLVSGIERHATTWKSNVSPSKIVEIEVPKNIEILTRTAAKAMGADILGVDWLELTSGKWVALEANLCPGLHFPWKDWTPAALEVLLGRIDG
jgi:ribosomal protein S6--L-glutamate ligase